MLISSSLRLLSFSILVFFSLANQASERSSVDHTIIDNELLSFGVEITNYSPYYFLDEQNNYQGAAREILDLFAKHINKSTSYTPMPVARLFNQFLNSEIDLKFPSNPLWSDGLKESINIFYSKPLFNIKETVLVLDQFSYKKSDEKHTVKSKDVTKINYIGTILGFTTPGIDEIVKSNEFTLVQVQSIEQLVHMLVSERVQGVYFNEKVALAQAKKMYPSVKIKNSERVQPFEYGYHLSSINHPELINAFNQFLDSHAVAITRIKKRYGVQ